MNYTKTQWIFIIGFIIFIIFVIINKGFAIGDKVMHPAFSFHLSNIFFMLFLFFFLFLPLNISNFPKVIQLIKKNKKIILLIIIIFTIYMFTFVNNHPYNTQWTSKFLRNWLLTYFTSTILLKILFFLPIAYSVLSISLIKLHKKSFYLIYPFAILYLLPSWLIEQRYYLIPFTLLILFRKKESKLVEYSLIIIYIVLSLILFCVTERRIFFL